MDCVKDEHVRVSEGQKGEKGKGGRGGEKGEGSKCEGVGLEEKCIARPNSVVAPVPRHRW